LDKKPEPIPELPATKILFETSRAKLPSVSVVIPSYNCEHLMEETLSFVKAQTLENVELIVIDDQSKDQSTQVAGRWLKDNQARFSHAILAQTETKSGFGQLRNIGFALAEARYVFVLDADNIASCDEVTAASSGSAAFLLPSTSTLPDRRWPPSISNVDI
jgi:glycosyltransferase involved in cell wall biosynthesis